MKFSALVTPAFGTSALIWWRKSIWRGTLESTGTRHGAKAINLIIETRRLAHGLRTFAHYRLRILRATSGSRPWRPSHVEIRRAA